MAVVAEENDWISWDQFELYTTVCNDRHRAVYYTVHVFLTLTPEEVLIVATEGVKLSKWNYNTWKCTNDTLMKSENANENVIVIASISLTSHYYTMLMLPVMSVMSWMQMHLHEHYHCIYIH